MSLVPSGIEVSDDHVVLIETAREFAREVLLPLDRKWDRGESSVEEVLPKLAEMGFLSLSISEELNGLGCPCRIYAAILHEIAVWSPSTCVAIAVHHLTGNILDHCLEEPVRSKHLAEWGRSSSFAAFALSEADAGSDARSVKTTAREVDGGFLVSGEKMWISNGIYARWFLTLVKLEGVPEADGLCALLIDGRESGVDRVRIHGKTGIRGSDTAVIHFDDVFVPADHLVGGRGEGLKVMLSGLNLGRIGIAVQASGIAEACLNEATSYARQREQFGQPIGRFQAVGAMIADSATELEAAKVLIWRAACSVDDGVPNPMQSSMAKLYSSEAANRIAYRAVQVHGGAGYVNESRVEQLARDARVTTIYEGTSEIQRILIARDLARR